MCPALATVGWPVVALPLVALLCAAVPAAAQAVPTAPADTPAAPADAGIPVDSEVVRQKCGSCHRVTEGNLMSRISYRRASPENWEKTVKRMVALNNARLEPAEARQIIKYLSDHNGLAPEEARPVAFEYERRIIDYTYPDKSTSATCTACHSIGRVLSERRTREEWELLVTMHRGYYPLVDNQPMSAGMGFRRTRRAEIEPGPDGVVPDNRHPVDITLEHLAKAFPLKTPEWDAWSATMQAPRLAGKWAVTGYEVGEGPVYGLMTIADDPSNPGGFTTETTYQLPRTGTTVVRKGRSTVFTGFQWRGRAAAEGVNAEPWREVMFIERTGGEMWGRWFTGAYDETGVDVKLVRVGSDPLITGTSAVSIKTGGKAIALHIYGENLPAALTPALVGLGSGVTVSKVVSATPRDLVVELDIAANATTGPRDLTVAGRVLPKALVVYDRIDGIRVTPDAGMARVGGAVFPKGFTQFEAIAFNNGPDGKPNTKDDWNLGRVDAKWSVEEYSATFGDDDVRWVGTLDHAGRFTPNLDGPNPERVGNRNNIGDVWVVADYTPEGGKPMRGRAFLLVTVPVYMNWNSSEVGS
jgi:quinohemoprotein amine dehydrogenase